MLQGTINNYRLCNTCELTHSQLDIYHCKQRVIPLLQISHPDFKMAKREFDTIFLQITQPNSNFKTKEEFVEYVKSSMYLGHTLIVIELYRLG